ncbi:prolyl-tRNA synthetase associated domain-containing protein [Petroclostridium sp. X23]|uniref:prolyl-tRNA synthetase associated domain-containing protein n=1 Tax=Petroclostridium sp. X23 TaxID=3045146 RepID=UPI0024ACF534|nr:prolyl-tRNA synthetase associated domain-containing protein [Petroclostridium sp. X23]WHH58083.1 prolyl-tRNA synthetase associated domain-containing protein [Petroclostridium sp. X23]
MSDREMLVYKTLKQLNIDYIQKSHAPAFSIEDCKRIIEKLGGGIHCKNLFLCNRQETEFFLLLIRYDKKFRTSDVSKQINRSRLSFGSEENLLKYLNVYPGSVSPMGLINDKNNNVILLMDKDLLAYETIWFHPCVNTASIAMQINDFMTKFLPYTNHQPIFVTI